MEEGAEAVMPFFPEVAEVNYVEHDEGDYHDSVVS